MVDRETWYLTMHMQTNKKKLANCNEFAPFWSFHTLPKTKCSNLQELYTDFISYLEVVSYL